MNRMTKILCTAALCCAGVTLTLSTAAHAAVTDSDKAFLTKASQANFDEIKLSELAQSKASNPQVKGFANKMVSDHTALGESMKPFAQAWDITPASSLDSEHQQIYDKLNGLSGAEFDKEYMNAMLKDHHEAVDLFTHEAQTTTDVKFKRAVMHGKSVVMSHLKMAESLDPKLSS